MQGPQLLLILVVIAYLAARPHLSADRVRQFEASVIELGQQTAAPLAEIGRSARRLGDR